MTIPGDRSSASPPPGRFKPDQLFLRVATPDPEEDADARAQGEADTAEFPWRHKIYLEVWIRQGRDDEGKGTARQVGVISLLCVDRAKMDQDRFGAIINYAGAQVAMFDLDHIFDSKGRLPTWVSGPDARKRRGTGVWASELSDSSSLITSPTCLSIVTCAAEDRRGLATLALQRLCTDWDDLTASVAGLRGGLHFLVTSPLHDIDLELRRTWESRDYAAFSADEVEAAIAARDQSESFFTSFGFRRVGLSPCVAFALSPTHPSRSLPASHDAVQPRRAFPWRSSEATHPLSWALGTSSRSSGPTAFLDLLAAASPEEVRKADELGQTLLHQASAYGIPEAVRAVLDRAPDLCSIVDTYGDTPADAARFSLEMRRTQELEEIDDGEYETEEDRARDIADLETVLKMLLEAESRN